LPTPGGPISRQLDFSSTNLRVARSSAVEGGLRGEVELFECFVGGEPGEPHPAVEATLL
jgi:hypothetical protein